MKDTENNCSISEYEYIITGMNKATIKMGSMWHINISVPLPYDINVPLY